MQRAEVRIIEPQQVQSKPSDVSNSEAEALLAKYGFSNRTQPQYSPNPTNNLTAEEMWAMEQRRVEEEKQRKQKQMYGPKPYSFDKGQVGYSETKWASIEGNSFGIQVQIVSNMPINK